jgi:signal transduction histidine kinase
VRLIRSVRFKIVLLLLVPFVALSALWAFAASLTLGEGLNLRHVTTIQDHLGYPSGALGSALQAERRLSLVYLGGRDPAVRASLESQRLVTDRQTELFQRLAGDRDVQDVAEAEQKQWTAEVLRRLGTLGTSRRSVDSGSADRPDAYETYTEMITAINGLQTSLTTLRDLDAAHDARNQVELGLARELLSQEDALLAGALAAGHITGSEHGEFIKLVGAQRFVYDEVAAELRAADQAHYRKITSTPEFRRLRTMESRIIQQHVSGRDAPPGDALAPDHPAAFRPPVSDADWKTTTSSILTKLRGLELSSAANAEARSQPIADGIIRRIVIAGGFGLGAILIMVVLSIWVGRSVIRELTKLKRAALELASERLPSVIRRLRRGEDVDVAAEAPSLSFGTDEIDQVGQAFNAARRTAIQGAVEEARLRRSISDVFINLARRNQALLHRQLSLLDAMERRVADPDELEDLFRLDHLATRMRRHAEGLIILSGQAPGRGWRNPVPAVDVVRAAAAEVEDYARVTVTPMPRVAVAGTAVADLIHLLAELIENATLFSPPHTTVQVSGQLVAHGFAVEIEDRGLSMDPAALAAANERLADPPEFDLSSSARLGLFVVGRLAKRHDIQVTLRTSPYGGTTAIVLVPGEIVVRDDGFEIEGRPPALTRRAEDSLIPVGAIGAGDVNQAGQGGSSWFDAPSGSFPGVPMRPEHATFQPSPRQTAGNGMAGHTADRPPLPQRRTGPQAQPMGRPPMGSEPVQPVQPMWQQPEPQRRQPPAPPQQPPHGPASSFAEPAAPSYGGRPFGGQPPAPPSFGERSGPSAPPANPSPPAGPRPPASASPSAGRAAGETAFENERPALPRRVRQANLAPQLRDEQMTDPAAAGDEGDERSPEELRTMLSSIQKGWLRGRSAAEQIDDEKREDQ